MIHMLEKLRDHKRYVSLPAVPLHTYQVCPKIRQHLSQFSSRVLSASSAPDTGAGDVKMEVDSMASTPLGD